MSQSVAKCLLQEIKRTPKFSSRLTAPNHTKSNFTARQKGALGANVGAQDGAMKTYEGAFWVQVGDLVWIRLFTGPEPIVLTV